MDGWSLKADASATSCCRFEILDCNDLVVGFGSRLMGVQWWLGWKFKIPKAGSSSAECECEGCKARAWAAAFNISGGIVAFEGVFSRNIPVVDACSNDSVGKPGGCSMSDVRRLPAAFAEPDVSSRTSWRSAVG